MTIPDRLLTALADRYTLERELGQGGMATVYLARDLRHDRRVAIKVLRPELGAVIGADRFLSEIRTTANLQHPNILPLFDSGDAQGLLWYAMPYVEGETLRDRLGREKQLPVPEAVRLATEVASALDYAHRQGIIHRDIKPENILLHDGRPLVADFGIALAASKAGGTRMTETGMSLGTPHYMSPEQAMGERELDARSDVYALGAVLYECLTGDPPFTGSTAQAIVAKVVTEKPSPPSTLRDTVPAGVEQAVLTALQKLPADRYASARAFADALARPDDGRRASALGPSARPPIRVTAALAAVALLATAAAVWGWLRGTPVPAPEVLRFASTIPAEASDPNYSPRFAFSPDSRTLVYRAADDQDRPSLFVRRLDALGATAVGEGTAFALSPDGTQIMFATRGSSLRIMPLSGGGSRTLADGVDIFAGMTWGGDGTIYFGRRATGEGAIWAVSERGGEPKQVVAHDTLAATRGWRAPRLPFLLPGGRAILVTYWRGSGTLGDIAVANLASGKVTYLAKGTHAQYADGFLTFVGADGQLMAAPFDTDRLALTAPPRATGIQVGLIGEATMAYGLAPDGTLVYSPTVGGRASLVWVDRSGREEPVDPTHQRAFTGVSISPDGTRLALGIGNDDQESIWVYDPATEALSRLTFEGSSVFRPLWSPDGSRIAYVSDRGSAAGIRSLWWQPADGTGEPSLIAASPRHAQELTWSADGSRAAYRDGYSDGGSMRDIHVLRVGTDTTPRPFLATPFDEQNPKLSPDGRWLAYVSDESGQREVYVRPFPDGGGRWQVSADGAVQPLWRRDGRELYFLTLTGDLMVVPVLPGASFSHGRPQVLFPARRYLRDPNATTYDITPDGSRFLFIRRGDEDPLVTVIHWTEELRRLFGSGE